MSDTVQRQVRAFVTDTFLFGDAGHPLGEADSLIEAGIVDSTGVLELVAFVEEAFGIQVDDAEIVPANLDSIARIAGYVVDKRGLTAVPEGLS
jgi:acyl carrier protein